MTGDQPPRLRLVMNRPEVPNRRSRLNGRPKLMAGSLKTRMNTGLLLGMLALLTLFSACDLPGTKISPLREPPLIPSPPEASAVIETKAACRIANFSDMEEIHNFSPNLAQAVATALSMGVLKPATAQSQFEPEHPITYGEFRQWANDYQEAINALNQAATDAAPNSPPPAAGPLTPPPAIAAHLGNSTMLPAEMLWGSHGVREQSPLTRESLCALAVFLNGQDATARKLNPTQIETAQPSQDSGNTPTEGSESTEGSLSQLSDYAQVSPWALKYVAVAYKNDWFQPLFNLSTAQITTAEGLHPSQIVTRGEAMLLLDLLYGHQKNIASPSSTDKMMKPTGMQPNAGDTLSPTSMNPNGNMGLKSIGPSSQMKMSGRQSSNNRAMDQYGQPVPIGHLQSVQEKGPQGTRNAIQVSGPE
jgi:hypothetical protein